jgi:hypothetical protein
MPRWSHYKWPKAHLARPQKRLIVKSAALASTALLITTAILSTLPAHAKAPQMALPKLAIEDVCQAGDVACINAEKAGLAYLKSKDAARPAHFKTCERLYSRYSSLARCVKALVPDSPFELLPMPDRDPKSVCQAFYERKPDAVLRRDLCDGREADARSDLIVVWDKLPQMTQFMCGWGIVDREIEIPLYTSMSICVAREIEKSKGNNPGPFRVPPEYMSEAEFMGALQK